MATGHRQVGPHLVFVAFVNKAPISKHMWEYIESDILTNELNFFSTCFYFLYGLFLKRGLYLYWL